MYRHRKQSSANLSRANSSPSIALPLHSNFPSSHSVNSLSSASTQFSRRQQHSRQTFPTISFIATPLRKRVLLLILWVIFFRRSIVDFFSWSVGKGLHLVTVGLLRGRANTPENALWKAEVPGPLSYAQLYEEKFTIDLVVSHCDISLDWIFGEWSYPYQFQNITIYSKCNQPVLGAAPTANIVQLPNVGRCDHTYAHYMANDYQKSSNKNHVVLFLKDNDNHHRLVYSRHRSLTEMLYMTREYGFACHEDRLWQISRPSKDNSIWQILLHPVCQLSTYHEWSSLTTKDMLSYVRVDRDQQQQTGFKSTNGDSLGEYADRMGIRQPQKIVPVCYGGNFMALGKQIEAKMHEKLWHRMEQSLSRASNVAEGHFVERLWAALLAFPLKEDQISTVLRQASEKEPPCFPGKNFQGALTKY